MANLIFFMVILIGATDAKPTEQPTNQPTDQQPNSDSIKESPLTLVILSESGVGKSALGNVLLGHQANRTGGLHGCFTGKIT